jgi:hypothetical protein
MPVRAFDHWWTSSEWAVDNRTGTVAFLTERSRRPDDRVRGYECKVWEWTLARPNGRPIVAAEGVAPSQKAARAAARKAVRRIE